MKIIRRTRTGTEAERIRLALSIISGRVTGLTVYDYKLLGCDSYEFGKPSWREVKEKAEEVILEALTQETVK